MDKKRTRIGQRKVEKKDEEVVSIVYDLVRRSHDTQLAQASGNFGLLLRIGINSAHCTCLWDI